MKLRTSCCKPVTLKKDILRFAPIWAIYLAGAFLILAEAGYSSYDRFAKSTLLSLIESFGVVNLCYATLIAACLFGDLYNTKLCYSLHAMPYRRESWLGTHLLSGFLFSFVPNLALCALLMARLEAYWFLGLYWLLAVTLQFICFYGIATVSALLTGNRFAMLLVTAVLNFVSLLIYATLELVYVPMMTGVVCNSVPYFRFCPVVEIFQHKYFAFTSIKVTDEINDIVQNFYRYDGLADGWGYLAIMGLVGVAAMAFGFWLYRKRHLESAGDFIAFPKLKGIACVIMTLCFSLAIGLLGELLDSFLVWLFVGLVIGFFGSLMLLERRLKVFRKKTFLGFAAIALVMGVSLLAVNYDWFGIESWTPKADQVASVTVSDSRSDYDFYDRLSTIVEDPADIQRIIDAHEDIYNRMDEPNNKRYPVYLEYKMKSGRTVIRYYQAPAVGEGYATIRSYLYNAENVLGFTDPAAAAQKINYMYTTLGEVPPALYEKLLTALQTEAYRGKVEINGGGRYYVEYYMDVEEGGSLYRSLAVSADAEEVVQLMNSPGMQMGYADWNTFVSNVQELYLYDQLQQYFLKQNLQESLLLAIRKDLEAGCDLGGRGSTNDAFLVGYYVRSSTGRTDYREFYINYKATNTMQWLQDNGYVMPHQ